MGHEGGGNTGTCAVPVVARALGHAASPRPILASPRERELRKRTCSTPHDTGAAHATAILGAIVVFIDSNQLLGYYAVRDSLFSRKRQNHATTRPGRSGLRPLRRAWRATIGIGIWDLVLVFLGVKIGVGTFLVWDLGLGSGEIQRPWSGPVVLETPHLGPRKFCR